MARFITRCRREMFIGLMIQLSAFEDGTNPDLTGFVPSSTRHNVIANYKHLAATQRKQSKQLTQRFVNRSNANNPQSQQLFQA